MARSGSTSPINGMRNHPGMHYPIARAHNLYVLSWMTNVRFCLERGIQQLQTGQTAYAAKLRLGSRLDKLWVCFKHRGKVLNGIFRTFGPLMRTRLAQLRQFAAPPREIFAAA